MEDVMVRTLVVGGLLLAGALMQAPAIAQEASWPAKPVRFIVPFPPGGSVDPLARLLGARLSAALAQQFVVDNRSGGSGSIGTAMAAKSAPDGYTYMFAFDTHAVNPSLIPNLPYDTAKDLAPVMLIGTAPMAVVTNPSKPYASFADVIKAAKAKPAAISYGTVGSGSLGHLSMTLLEHAGGFRLVHVPYKGGGPMSVDAMGGQIDLGVATVAVLGTLVRGGKLRALGVTGDKRSHTMPEVPTLAEQGFPGFSTLAWWGVLGPAGIPPPLLNKVHAELTKILNQPDVRTQLGDQLGMDLVVSTPAGLQKFVNSEISRWAKVVRENQIRAD
jgi:tripartite-type tricarboxylate transporter receptor subunit TctC